MGLLRFALYPAKRGTAEGLGCNDMSASIKLSLALNNNREKTCNRMTCIKENSMLEKTMFLRLFITCLLLFCLLPRGYSYGFEARGQECSKCHTLNKDEARDLLKNVIPDVVILDVRLSPVKGLWEVDLETRGRKAIVYVDFLKKHFFSGALVSIGEKKNLTQERFIELNKVDVSQIPLENALVMGDPKARIRVIVFTDPD
jgi:thiol:disulfide interchange protein DsbC